MATSAELILPFCTLAERATELAQAGKDLHAGSAEPSKLRPPGTRRWGAEGARAETDRIRVELNGQIAKLRADFAGKCQSHQQFLQQACDQRDVAVAAEARLREQQEGQEQAQQRLKRAAEKVVQRLLAERNAPPERPAD
ncbi:hypothetical protein [Streptosporangium amethystogenes]|uniref:hypothetical protein n=1 Tax=Streptosporangium amethystogenes TaxID=2002 RepID=UPI0004C967AA|nr:hypothetical protein [Streptosporangium amethystogenes]